MTSTPSDQEILALKDSRVPVEQILALFGVRVRNHQTVYVISRALADVGLATVPDFAVCHQRDHVDVVASAAVVPEMDAEEEDEEDPLPSHVLPQRIQIGELEAARRGVTTVNLNGTVSQATYLMRTKGLAQIPVITGMAALHGVVTWSSLARMYETGKSPTLENAMQKDSLPVADARQEFFSCLPVVKEHGYLLVRGDDGCLSGLVTMADITERFEGTARPFFLVGEIESLLRRCLGAALDQEAIRAVQTNKKADQRSGLVTDLMFGDYLRLLDGTQSKPVMAANADANWAALGWTAMDRIQFVRHLERVKDIRNRIAHFDAKPLPAEMIQELVAFTKLLRDFAS
ncbi:CBS domain protein [Kitasatospora cineracea]|uniref:CBS domain protein n=1 Tax=Kitasatospora cineracea TaxID=88074 RepID=A0A8G1UCD6_9ACTN|nr:CBS domain-containing protein [Kitasatospora cineracea]ROR38150.1 CBS domain protein [Kitasatospora cineracea]